MEGMLAKMSFARFCSHEKSSLTLVSVTNGNIIQLLFDSFSARLWGVHVSILKIGYYWSP